MIDIRRLYQIMVAHCGEQNWPAESKPEIVLGAILVQNTSWESAQKSLDQLRKPRHLIRSAFYNSMIRHCRR